MKKHLGTTKQRLLSLLLSICMIGTLLPTTTLAEPADVSNQETSDIITAWQWIDEEDVLDPETGSLALPGASEQTPVYFDDVTELLPTQILATVENTEDTEAEAASETITLGDWACEEYPKEGAYTGSYTFAATLPEGYVLSEEAKALAVTVELGEAQMYESAESVTVGDFTVTGGTLGTDYTYAGGVLTIKSKTPVTIKNVDPATSTTDRIEVESGISANITLAGVNINVSSNSNTAAFKIADDSTGNVTITLADGSENKLISGIGCAGLQKNGAEENIGKLTIQDGTNGTGKLTATSQVNGAGIGGGNGGSGSNITISGGTVTATGRGGGAGIGGSDGGTGSNITISGGTVTANGGLDGAGIGGGKLKAGESITISGGTVTANGGDKGAGIGGGNGGTGSEISIEGGTVTATGSNGGAGIGGGKSGSGSDITISGGSVKAVAGSNANDIGGGSDQSAVTPTLADGSTPVYPLTIANPDNEEVFIDGVSYTPVNHKAADGTDTNLYVYLTGEHHLVMVGEETWLYMFNSNSNTFTASPLELILYATNGGTLTYGTDYTYENNVLTIKTGTPITIRNTDPNTATKDRIEVADGISADVTLAGVNIDVSSVIYAAAFKIADDSTGNVTITLADDSENTLKSGKWYAGLQKNGVYSEILGKLTIKGNTGALTATGGDGGAGIGGGAEGSGSEISIEGGTVTATGGGNGGAGIGGGYNGYGSYITISGGTVTATGGNGAGIGGGYNGYGSNITISGGTVTATSDDGGAGIGGGAEGSGSEISIEGGTVTATSQRSGAGIGGGGGSTGSKITISGGTVTATGNGGAGIGGGYNGSGSNITISNSTVTATGSAGGAGIGGGNGGNGGTIAIYNSFVMASSISDTSSQNSWSGLIFNGEAGKVYGDSFTISTDCTIPEGKTLVVAAEQTISITETATFTNAGTIYNSGTFIGKVWNYGTIHNTGTFSNASAASINQYSISIEQIENSCQSVELSLKVNDTAFEETVTYSLNEAEANAVIENGNTLKVADSGVGTQIPVTATFTVDGVPMTRTESVTITSRHVYDNNGFCTICNGYQPATKNTEGDYEIGNAGQLYWFAALVNGTNGLTQNLSANAVLTADITVNTGDVANCGGTKQAGWKDWTPIVGSSYLDNYAGTFDGQNHTVSGLYFNDSNVNNVGLFGYIGTNSKISNVGVVDSYFCGKDRVGGVCGSKYGTVENCYSASTVSGEEAVGGVCGDNYKGNLLNCYNTGAVNCSVSGGWYIGGVCGILNDGTIQNCYSTGTVGGSSASTVGSVCGFNSSGTISNCYSDSSKCDKNAVGINNSTVEKTEGKTAAQFASGEVAYRLNDSSSEDPVWYQNIDNGTADTYPVLDSDHGTVYQCTPCTAVYSNTSDKTVAHTFHVYEIDNTKHTCEKCGATEAHSTTNFTYSADEETDRITVYCNEGGCGTNIGYVELAAPSETMTYNSIGKEATISDTVPSVDFSSTTITYKQGETTLTSAPKDAGTYTANITLGTGEDAASVSVEYTIDKATPTISWGMLSGSTWVEMTSMPVTYTGSEIAPNKLVPPTVTLVNGETYSGEISYSYRVQGSSDAFTSGLPTAIGIYEVKASIAADGNYKEAASTVKLIVNWLNTTAAAVLTDQKNATLSGDTWWAQSVTFKAPNGFTISNSLAGSYGTSFVYDTQTDADGTEVTYYLKNSDGEIAQKTATVRIDKTAPTWPENGGIRVKENWWKSLVNTISFGLFYKDTTVDVKACAADDLSGVSAYCYYVDTTGSTTVLSSDVLDTKTFTKVDGSGAQTLISLDSENKYVVYAYAVDKAGNKSDYVCTSGVVLDTTAPTISDITTPSKAELTLTDTSAKISFTGSEAGTCFYMISETELASITDFATSSIDNKGMTTWTAKEGVSSVEMTTEAKQITLSSLSPNTTYTLYLAAVDQAGNSTATVDSQSFTTCKTMPVVTKQPTISGTYGQTVSAMTLTDGTAKVGSDVITGTWELTDSNKTNVPAVGTTDTYQVTFTPESDIYDTVIVPVKPTVSKKAITVTIDDKTKTYGQDNPELTFTVPEGTLVGNDTKDALGVTLSCVATITSPVKEGGYAISGTSNSANYQVTVIPGVLTITKATPVITAKTEYTKTHGDIKFFLDATDNSAEAGLQYTVTESRDPSGTVVEKDAVVTVDARGYVTITGAGTAKITASLPETENYNAASKEIAIVVNQATYPPNRPGTEMFVSNRCTHVGDVPLTGDWEWQSGDTVLMPSETNGTAKYIGADKANYANTTADVSIMKLHDCDHVAGEILYTVNGDYAPTCTTAGRGHRECTICGELIESGILVNPAHSFSSTWTIDVPATTTSEGSKSHHCIVCDEKNDITVIPKLVISSGDNSGTGNNNGGSDNNNGGSGSSNNSGNTTTETPEVKVPDSNATPEVPAPAADTTPAPEPTRRPSTTKKQETSEQDIEAPFIKGDNGKEGWDVIRDEVESTTEGNSVIVDMNGASVVPGNVIADIQGKDITLVFDMGDGIIWSVNGQSIIGDNIGDIDFSVTVGTSTIPIDVINNVTGERYSKQISLAYDGEFGFTAVLSINMDKENAGLFANLFYYNEGTGELEFICADEIAEDGTAELTFTHASEYTIVVDEEPMNESTQELEETEEEETESEAETEEATVDMAPEKKGGLPWWIILVCVGVIVAGVGVFFVVRKKKMR